MKRSLSCVLGILLFLSSLSNPVLANQKSEETLALAENAKSAILIERDTGTVLYQKNPDEKLPPASMTKVMTMLLIMEALDSGKISLDEKVRTSEHAASMGGSQIFLEPGEEMTVKEMLQGIAIGSGNDASVAMAEHIAGSEEEFVAMMNERGKELGLKNTNFVNTTGLPAQDHYSTARDMAVVAKELLKYEQITEFTGLYEAYLRENTDKKFWLVNTNRLVKFYDGVDGLKTGYTNEAKYCLTATAKRDGMRVIAVVFGAPTPKDRNAQISKMLDYAFAKYKTHRMYEKDAVVAEATVSKGENNKVEVVTSESISLLTRKGEKVDDVEKKVVINDKIRAPLQKGDEVGSLVLVKNGKVLVESPLVVKDSVEKASWWTLYKRTFGNFAKVN
ncbi:D-Ala-D-Ala carboxypeptidase DacF [Bacillus oleivorans]|uniref:serine-type D-Ala-D-Ala carboxypeptidase n=1 Tax=Bacillus oleivorans TaxID=1448271 RepID=A0A285CLZ9_9BACI|nr:D-alanyl-D-alanine carboxypeptidase family protein [Bacillus oleivorans]SNX68078.1 D-Ala-D-Ala carboxypeptidase DacF [Bacillus oleivorans]